MLTKIGSSVSRQFLKTQAGTLCVIRFTYVMSFHAMLCYVMLCYVMLCYILQVITKAKIRYKYNQTDFIWIGKKLRSLCYCSAANLRRIRIRNHESLCSGMCILK